MPTPAAMQRDGTDHRHADAHGAGERVELFDQRVVGEQFEIVRLAGPHLAGRAQDAAHLFLAIGITGRAARLDQDAQTGPAQAVAVERRGEGHDGKVVLVAAQRSAFGRQDADDGVGMPLILSSSPTAEPKGKTVLASALPSTQTSRASSTSLSTKTRPSSGIQLCAEETAGRFAEHLHGGRGLGVAGLDAAAPKLAFDADGGGERGLFLNRLALFDA